MSADLGPILDATRASSRHAREGERWTMLQRLKNDALFAAAWLLVTLLPRLPRSALRALGTLAGDFSYHMWPRARAVARDNLDHASGHVPGLTPRRARQVYRTLGRDLADTLALLDPDELPENTLAVPPEALATLDAALAEGRGVVYVTAHLGPWERMACALAARGRPITAVVRGSYDRRLDRLLYDAIRRKRRVETIDRGRASTPFAILRALRRRRVVGFLIDLPGRVPTVPTMLFGRKTRTPVGPARIALRTRVPLVVGTPTPHHGGIGISIERIDYTDLVDRADADTALTQRMIDAVGRRILALPYHWPWMHPSFGDHSDRVAAPPPEPID